MGQHRAYEDRDAPARHFGSRDADRWRAGVERSARLSSAPPAQPPLLSLQRSAGNRAVVGLIQRLREGSGEARLPPNASAPGHRLIQRAWENVPAKFRTDNEEEAIPNSEYFVEAWEFKRYAPINKFRVPGQVYHQGPRSLAYLTADEAKTRAAKETVSAKAKGNIISLCSKSEGREQVIPAARVPQEGLVVWDGDVDDNGTVKDFHVGDAVEDLGIELPTLENREKSEKVRTAHASLKAAQIAGSALLDYDLNEFMKRLKAKLISEEDPVFLEDLPMEEAIAVVMKNLGTAPAGFDKTLPLLIDLWRSGTG